MPNDNKTVKPGLKMLAIAASAVLVAALAATGVLAYGQNNTGSNMTTFEEQANATDTAFTNMTETATASSNATNDTAEQADEATFTASASADSECSPVITTDDGAASNGTTSFIGTLSEDEAATMTASLDDSQAATLDALIENACDAIRDGKSVTALSFLSAAQDVLNNADTEAAEAEGEVQDEDESGNVDAADEEN